jgi:beta-lactamase class D
VPNISKAIAAVGVAALLLVAGAPLHAGPAEPAAWQERPTLSRLFSAAGVEGTLLIHDLQKNVTGVHNPSRAQRGFVPASTFQIVHALITISTEVVKDVDKDLFAYAGTPYLVRGRPFLPGQCDADISLRTAFTFSCIPVFQDVARRFGKARYQSVLREIDYGSGLLDGERVDRFWLEGHYTVSAAQQLRFLRRLYERDLPFSRPTINVVKDMMVIEEGPQYVLRAKAGHLFSTQPEVGWYVGWLERGARVYFFALNLDITKPEDTRARSAIVKAALEDLDAP